MSVDDKLFGKSNIVIENNDIDAESKRIIEIAKNIFNVKDKKVIKKSISESTILYNDPRYDLKDDHILWQDILTLMFKKNRQLLINLHGFRCAGTRLIMTDKNLKPIYPIEWDEETLKEKREKYLIPYKNDINTIFKAVYDKHMAIKNGAKYTEEIPF